MEKKKLPRPKRQSNVAVSALATTTGRLVLGMVHRADRE